MPYPIVLHHFDRSPFSEKIRVIFGFKGLAWKSVRIPPIMPKPDLTPLTGGYRRTPVMQIGADVFCDTQIIIREIERRFPSPTLFPSGGLGVPWALGMWTDRAFFQSAVNLVFGTLGPKVSRAFIEDRSQLRGGRFDLDKMRAAIPQMRDQMRAHLGWIEAQLGDGRKWLLGDFSLADVSAYMNVWYLRSGLAAEEDRAVAGLDKVFASLDQVAAWESRVRALGHGLREEMSADEALAIAAKASPETLPRTIRTIRTGGRSAITCASRPTTTGRSKLTEKSCPSRRSISPYAALTIASARSWSISRARASWSFPAERAGRRAIDGLRRLPRPSRAARGPLMRPSLLDPMFAPAGALPGIGPKNAKLFDRLLDKPQGARVVDVLFHLPQATVDRRARPKIRDAVPDTIVTIEARVTEHRGPPNARSRAPFKVLVEDDTGDVELVFFLANHEWVRSRLPVGATRWISGKLELWDGRRQMVHPDRVMNADELARLPPVEPVYGLTEGLYQRTVARAAEGALKRLPRLPEWISDETLSDLKLPSFAAALGALHRPGAPGDIDPASPAATRLAYDELFANQLALLLMRARMRVIPGRAHKAEGALARRLEAALPFSLTRAQRQAIEDIRADLRAEKRMLRLLQGDVGSGKTVVALMAMADVAEAGRQAAMMAPTEILARQHYERMVPLAAEVGLRIALLTGRDKAPARRASLAALAEGTIDIAVGTHALFQESVAFADLGLAVVDEQHRFGVRQRLALASKGAAVDLLVMTATPIPRSLVLAYFGDMDVSALREKPPGRQPIDTRVLPIERLDEVVARLSQALASGARAYWICPLVEESETLDVAAAEDRAEALGAIFGDAVGLAHGKMAGPERDAAMERFQRGITTILVATTVVEVGVDVAEATIMIVEHAERFGLAQLHQLRGRVGRGAARSACLLLYKGPLGEGARARLEILRETEDGFRIAEEDLKLRGEGDVLGARQAGAPGFRFARLDIHSGLLGRARAEAEAALKRDERLAGEANRGLRLLLYLFERDEAARLIEAG